MQSEWYSGEYEITTCSLEELLATKMRALYQRKKGRDLFDLYYVLEKRDIDCKKVIRAFMKYLDREGSKISKNDFVKNVQAKLIDPDFVGDTKAILRPGVEYEHTVGWNSVKTIFIDNLI